jgi:hypothetical protein
MFHAVLTKLQKTVSGVATKQLVAGISHYHRIQASPDCRRAAEMVCETRRGHWLRRLINEAQADEPVRVRARVVSRLYDGAIENVTATIPGETKLATVSNRATAGTRQDDLPKR